MSGGVPATCLTILSRAALGSLLAVAVVAIAVPGAAQEPGEIELDTPSYAETEGPGHFRVGRLMVTPTFRIETLGIDTNVFYTATDRQTDFIASGGPGLRLVLPVGPSLRAFAGGEVQYVYFLRTESQRHLGGNARAGLWWAGNRFTAWIDQGFESAYVRPSFEVDPRVLRNQSIASLGAQLKAGRLLSRAELSLRTIDVGEQEYLGTNLGDTLSREQDRTFLGFEFRLTPKTFLVVEGDDENHRFPRDPGRDADSNRLYGGARVDSATRLSGRAVAGLRVLRPRERVRGETRQVFCVDTDLGYRVGRKTLLGARFNRDLQFSAFVASTGSGADLQEQTEIRLERLLADRFDLRLYLRWIRLRGDAPLTLWTTQDAPETAVRDDAFREVRGDIGYYFRHNLRIAVAATYAKRHSSFADLGIDGLLIGGTVTYAPSHR